jgi:hypothetical protein
VLEKLLVIAVVIVLPQVAIGAGYAFLIRRSLATREKIPLYAGVASGILCAGFLSWAIYSIVWSSSSTAAIGFILLPFYLLTVAALGYAVSWSVLTLSTVTGRGRRYLTTARPGKWKTMVALALLLAIAFAGQHHLERRLLLSLARSEATESVELARLTKAALSHGDLQLLTQLANNPASKVTALEEIFDHCAHQLADELARPCYGVFLGLAKNHRTPARMLTALARRSETSVRVAVARHANTPVNTIVALSRDGEELVRTWVTQHSVLPGAILRALSADDSDVVRLYAQAAVKRRALEPQTPGSLAN